MRTIMDLWNELDNQQGQMQVIALDYHNQGPRKRKEIDRHIELWKQKYESNLKFLEQIQTIMINGEKA